MLSSVAHAEGAAEIVPPKMPTSGEIFVPGLAPRTSAATGIVMVPAAASNVAGIRASSSQVVKLIVPIGVTPQLPRREKGCRPGSRGGGQVPAVGSQTPRLKFVNLPSSSRGSPLTVKFQL